MARINIEDELFTDVRFRFLSRELGNEDEALGMLVRFWHIAQKHWGRGRLVPKNEFLMGGFEALSKAHFVDERPDGYYARGSEERFAWYLERVNAGKASARARLKKYGSAQPLPEHSFEDSRTLVRRPSEPLTLTLTPTLKEEVTTADFFVKLLGEYSKPPLRARTVLMLSPRDRAKAHALLTKFPDPEYWRSVMKRAQRSPYLCGETDRPFRFALSFLLQPHAHLKIMNGDYDPASLYQPRKEKVKYEDADSVEQ